MRTVTFPYVEQQCIELSITVRRNHSKLVERGRG